MPAVKKNVEPAIQVGDKLVQVGPLSWAGVKDLLDTIRQASLPMPDFDSLRSALLGLVSQAGEDAALEWTAALETNLPIFKQWLFASPPILTTLVVGSGNLTAEEFASLSAAEAVRVARAAWQALVESGFFNEVGGFFGELLGGVVQQATTEAMPEPAAASTPPSAESSTDSASG